MYRLLFESPAPKEPVVVEASSFTIGRDAGCQLRLCEDGVAERHACIERSAGGYHLRGLDTANGVFVNGQRITEHRLESGDELEIGAVRMRFEIVYGVAAGTQRRPVDLVQLAAATIVVLVIAGQVALLSSVFSETRPKKMNMDTGRGWRAQRAVIGQTERAAAVVTPVVSEPPSPVRAPTPSPLMPAVLNRMIRIVRVDRGENDGMATLSIQAKAQVGERKLDTSAVAICVHFAVPGGAAESVAWREPVWLTIPGWENFKTKVFTVKFPGGPRELSGFVVRTYYRGELQDVAVAPSSLQSFIPVAPNPLARGAS